MTDAHLIAATESVPERGGPGRNLVACAAGAGVLAGVLEFGYAARGLDWSHPGSELVLLTLTVALFGLCGYAYGLLLWAVDRLCRQPLAAPLRTALIAALWLGLITAYHRDYTWTLAAMLPFTIFWTWRSASQRTLFALFGWIGFLALLRPLFAGRAMVRVFSTGETYGLFVGVMFVTGAIALVLLPQPAHWHPRARLLSVLQVTLALGAVLLLTVLSSVFLVRLWGFHTMEYLEVTLIVLKIACLAVPLTVLGASLPTWLHRPSREANLILLVVLLAAVAIPARWVMRHDATARFLLPRLPDTQLMVDTLVSWIDYDGDSFSPLFGFGDCDDAAPDINPHAIDRPGNGVDENCLGDDLRSRRHAYFNLPLVVAPPQRPHPARRPKVTVFLLIDTLRADAIGATGQTGSLTPNLDAIARASVDFRHAYAQSNNTLESFPFFLHLGFRTFPRYHQPLSLPAVLKLGDIRSAVLFQSTTDWWTEPLDTVFLGFDKRMFPEPGIRNRTLADTAKLAVTELDGPIDSDRFLMVHFESLHDFATEIMEGERMIDQGVNLSEVIGLLRIEGFVALLKERYLHILSEVDRAVGQIWERVRAIEQEADVLLIVTSDHGEEFYEHRGLFHMGTLYEELLRVPLLVYRTAEPPRTESAPVGLYRLPATMLKFFGYGGPFVDELDLLRTPLMPFEVFAYFSTRAEWTRRSFMILDGTEKLIYNESRNGLELYDLATDPLEQHNLIDDARFADRRTQLTDKLDTTLYYMNYGDMPPSP